VAKESASRTALRSGTQSTRRRATKAAQSRRPATPKGGSNVDVVAWASIPGPRYYDPREAEKAFAYLADPECDVQRAGSAIRFAVGNDHRGTLYPAAAAAAGLLAGLVLAGPGRPREVALGVLLDWWGVFYPEPGYESFTNASGEAVDLVAAISEAAHTVRPALPQIVAEDPGAGKLARLLMNAMDEDWQRSPDR
jgi:hypothetical protein